MMAEKGKTRPSCCRRHAVALGVMLLILAMVMFAVAMFAGTTLVSDAQTAHPALKKLKMANEVSEIKCKGERKGVVEELLILPKTRKLQLM